jgi:hypothetical protein
MSYRRPHFVLALIMRIQSGHMFVFLLSCFLIAVQLGCSRSEPLSMVLLNDSTPPCWFGICPGSTPVSEALTILSSSPHVEPESVVDKPADNKNGYISFRFRPKTEDFGRLYYTNSTITEIEVNPRPRNSLTFEQIVEVYGEPDWVWAYSDCADSRWLYVSLIFQEQGLYIKYFDDDWRQNESAELSPSQRVDEVLYYDPEMLEDLLMNFEGANWLGYGYTYEDILRRLQPWEGYSPISIVRECF